MSFRCLSYYNGRAYKIQPLISFTEGYARTLCLSWVSCRPDFQQSSESVVGLVFGHNLPTLTGRGQFTDINFQPQIDGLKWPVEAGDAKNC